MKQDEALAAYFAEAASWDADRAAMNARSARIAWRVATGACVLTGVALVALMLLMPLKRVDPFVIRVDNSTGIIDVVPVFVGQAPMPEVVTRYFLDHYLTVCERFNFSTAESDYEECSSFHAPARHQEWMALWDRTNPSSPLNRYRDGTERSRAGELDHVLRAQQRCRGSRAGPVHQDASAPATALSSSRTGSPRSSTSTQRRPSIRACAAGIRSASRSSTTAPKLRC